MAPTITSGGTAPAINENSGTNQVVYTVTSTDTGDISGGVTYGLKSVGDFAAFSINANSGDVTLTGDPDFETKPSYNFTVVATDAAGNFSEQGVSLAINDIGGALAVFETSALTLPFGLALGSSSDSGRMFQSASEEIDVRVALDDPTLISADGIWGGSANFGSEDRVALAAKGSDAADSVPTPEVAATNAAIALQTSPGSVGLWADSTPLDPSTPGAAGSGGNHADFIVFANVPGLTSQGLA